jgi:hypothetical protein
VANFYGAICIYAVFILTLHPPEMHLWSCSGVTQTTVYSGHHNSPSVENVKKLEYLRTKVTNQDYISPRKLRAD